MAYKDILVHMGGAALEQRARLAVSVAEAFGAHVTGLHVHQLVDIPPYVEAQLTAEVIEAQERFAEEDRVRARTAFDAAVNSAANVSSEWRDVDGDVVDTLHLHGFHADMLVLGQADPDAYGIGSMDVVGRTVLGMGRPVLVTPYAGEFTSVGKRVLVCWDTRATAARALGDSLPFLKKADEVSVISINPNPDHADMAGVDVSAHLARHGIKVDAQHVNAGDLDIGAMMLSRAADFGADMMVMGAYGHARWRELVLGGVTDHILAHMTVPVLMSH